MADALTFSKLALPNNITSEIWEKVQQEAVLPRLANAKPQKFGKTDVMVLTGTPKAQIVGEGEAKGSTTAAFETKTVVPVKLQTTVRVSDEFIWGDEDYKLEVFDTVKEQITKSLVDALDLIGIHKINPATGEVTNRIDEAIKDAQTVIVAEAGKEDIAIDNAYKAVIANDYIPNGIAADGTFAAEIATARDANGYRLYPNGINGYLGLTAAAGKVKQNSNIEAIVGDFSSFVWGVQKDIPLQVIQYGDPDNQGRDLKGHNEVAIRAEVVYGVGIMDLDAFALVTTGEEVVAAATVAEDDEE